MFEVDLLNTVGLQKHISRIKIQDNKKKHIISFKNLFKEEGEVREHQIQDSKESGVLSILLVSFIAIIFFFFGFVDYNKTFLSGFFQSSINEEEAMIYIAGLLTEEYRVNSFENITLDKSLDVTMVFNSLDELDIIKNSGIDFSYKVYELKNSYKVIFSHPIKNKRTHLREDFVLSTIVQRYENDYILDAVMYDQTLLFTSDDKTIIKILDELIHFGHIKIWPAIDKNRFNLEYSL